MDSYQVKQAIKFLLRKEGKSYEDLSEVLDVSLSTVKRMLTTESLSLERLAKICEWLDTDFAELQMIIETTGGTRTPTYSEEQDVFLAADLRYYNYLSKIIAGLSPETIAAKYGLNEKSTEKYLRDLEKHGLIRVDEKGIVSSRHRISWRPNGLLKQAMIGHVHAAFSDYFLAKQRNATLDDDFRLGFNVLRLSELTYREFVREMGKVRTKYLNLSNLEYRASEGSDLGSCYFALWHDFQPPTALDAAKTFEFHENISDL